MCNLKNQFLTAKNQAHFLCITTIRGCFICFLLPLLQVLYGITVTNNGNYDENLKTVDPLVVYTSTIAVQHLVETVYCDACSNTHGKIGPDLSKYGILNWNNKVAFSHQLLNSYIYYSLHTLRLLSMPFTFQYKTNT